MKKKKNINLFCSLMLWAFIPFIYQIVRTNLITDIPSTDGLSISGHIGWFTLINETLQAFLITPLYFVLNKVDNIEKLKQRIFQAFALSNGIYILFSAIVYIKCRALVTVMEVQNISIVTSFLQLEIISFIIANIVRFSVVIFVILGKAVYMYAAIVLKPIFTILGDLYLIPTFGVNGTACSDIVVNAALVTLCIIVMKKENILPKPTKLEVSFLKDYFITGSFSGLQILLNNIISMFIVCKLINEVGKQGDNWVANNFVYGLMLIPIIAMADIIKKDCKYKITAKHIKKYSCICIVSFIFWLALIPAMNFILHDIMGINNIDGIKYILLTLIPYYFAYAFYQLFDSILIGKGKTVWCFINSVVVNLVYYPIVYGMMLKGIFKLSITFICHMFGMGMVVHLIFSIIFYVLAFKNKKGNKHETRNT